jgi:hypothetical protein
MTAMNDPEWQSWQEDFRAMAEPPSASELRRRVVRHGRLLRVLFALEVAVGIAMFVGPAVWLAIAPTPRLWAWSLTLWGFEAIAVVFGWINRRGTWTPVDDSLLAQLDLTELRCRRLHRTLVFVPILFAAEIAFVLVFFAVVDASAIPLVWMPLAAASVAVAVWWVVVRGRIRRRLTEVTALRREMAAQEPIEK